MKHEKQKRIVDGSSYKVIRGKKDDCCNISAVKNRKKKDVPTEQRKANMFILCPRILTSSSVAQRYTNKRMKYLCRIFTVALRYLLETVLMSLNRIFIK